MNKKQMISVYLFVGVVLLGAMTVAYTLRDKSKEAANIDTSTVPIVATSATPSPTDPLTEEILAVTELDTPAYPQGKERRAGLVYQTMISSLGEGGFYFNFKPPLARQVETIQIYVQNRGVKGLDFRLQSPLGNDWIRTTIAPGKVYGGELTLNVHQAGNWHGYFTSADGSEVVADIAVIPQV